ncbi:hypothetical protein OHA89_36430 [Streptomyces sp. NBC_01546]|uniref:LGFP repeat-containing protein n=1 Tax=Streptomyces sp. NBC_00047 TaxID=2975627 RepID=UPI00224DFD51|nr:hypothetical protein [Streptomyces sp. NBC_00047]MCX5610235.1 hypothetical protein [Streptomyces sp. NBC_00047]
MKATLVALVSLAALTVQTSPAAAADICGRQVGGDILAKYIETGSETGPLGCPTTDEEITPDGRGRYNHFAGGSIYWTPERGAHPVWGAIRGKWEAMGWEKSQLGYPVGDELTNADGAGKRQQFEGGTLYWHPTLSQGAHPVWGRVGELWGQFGWEGGYFGYPTSDETPTPEIKGIMQSFSGRNAVLWWSPGFDHGDTNHPVCKSECVGYTSVTNTEWVKRTEIARAIKDGQIGGNVDISVIPTAEGFDNADTSYDRLWDQSFSQAPYPDRWLTAEQGSSLYKQLACHARYSIDLGGGPEGGNSWDLEGWARDVSWDYAMNPLLVWTHLCNWYEPA